MFVRFTKSEFEDFIKNNFPGSIVVSSPIYNIVPSSSEYIYDIPTKYPDLIIRVYSSVEFSTNLSRDYGSDALRVILLNKKLGKAISSPEKSHIKRMKNWRIYLKEAILELKNNINFYNRTCPKCKSPLALRISKTKKEFFGCTNYPDCTYTESLTPSKPEIIIKPKPLSEPKKEINPEIVKTIASIYNLSPSDIWRIKDITSLKLLIDYATPHKWKSIDLSINEYEAKKRAIYILNKEAGLSLTPDTIKINWIGELPTLEEKRWVYGSRTGKYHLVGPEDRDYETGSKSPEPFVLELSDIEAGATCPHCGNNKFIHTKEHRDRENEITHWDAVCSKCGLKGEILND